MSKKEKKLENIFNAKGGLTPVMAACQQGNAETVEMLIQSEYPVDAVDRTGKTALHYCAENRNIHCIRRLLKANPKIIDKKDEEGQTALSLCVICGSVKILRYLLENCADVNFMDCEGRSVIHWAVVCGQANMIDLLVDCGAEPSTCDSYGVYPLHYAAQMCGTNDMGNDPEHGLATLRVLLGRKVPPNVMDPDGRQPLFWAALAGSSDACELLLDAGADIASTDRDGLSALHIACSRGSLDCIDVLLNKGNANVDAVDNRGLSPVFYGAMAGHVQTLNLLMEWLANPTLQDKRGRSPIHYAAARGNIACLQFFYDYGVNMEIADEKRELPMHYAAHANRTDVLQLFLSTMDPKIKDTKINIGNTDGRTCLHLAVQNNNLEMCKLLLENKALLNPLMRKHIHYLSPYDVAILKGYRDIASFLRIRGGKTGKVVSDKAARVLTKAMRRILTRIRARRRRESHLSQLSSVWRTHSQASRVSDMLQVSSQGSGVSTPQSLVSQFLEVARNKSRSSSRASSRAPSVHTPSPLPPAAPSPSPWPPSGSSPSPLPLGVTPPSACNATEKEIKTGNQGNVTIEIPKGVSRRPGQSLTVHVQPPATTPTRLLPPLPKTPDSVSPVELYEKLSVESQKDSSERRQSMPGSVDLYTLAEQSERSSIRSNTSDNSLQIESFDSGKEFNRNTNGVNSHTAKKCSPENKSQKGKSPSKNGKHLRDNLNEQSLEVPKRTFACLKTC